MDTIIQKKKKKKKIEKLTITQNAYFYEFTVKTKLINQEQTQNLSSVIR